MSLKQGINLTIRNVVVALTIGVLFASTNALAAQGQKSLVAMNVDSKFDLATVEQYSNQKEVHSYLKSDKKIDDKQLMCLATNIYHEAGGESAKGKAAVAHVTLNRTNSIHYPKSICSVVHQKSGRGCQFSWTCDRRPDKIPNKSNNKAWKESLNVALLVLQGIIKDPTKGAMFFHEKRVNTGWGRSFTRTALIGNHIFYRRG